MSGICSAHKGHDPNCSRCNAWSFEERQAWDSYVAAYVQTPAFEKALHELIRNLTDRAKREATAEHDAVIDAFRHAASGAAAMAGALLVERRNRLGGP